ncbi:MAG: hypothetical protein QOK15_314, partial [Nocardioidaceae bacterium]|nr:hypothetical protein [Nocardioidaceae bacterium]
IVVAYEVVRRSRVRLEQRQDGRTSGPSEPSAGAQAVTA